MSRGSPSCPPAPLTDTGTPPSASATLAASDPPGTGSLATAPTGSQLQGASPEHLSRSPTRYELHHVPARPVQPFQA